MLHFSAVPQYHQQPQLPAKSDALRVAAAPVLVETPNLLAPSSAPSATIAACVTPNPSESACRARDTDNFSQPVPAHMTSDLGAQHH